MEINLNQQCTVVLTSRGVEALARYYDDICIAMPKKYVAGEEYKAELWLIMNIFGGDCYMGPTPPIETVLHLAPMEI